VDVIALVLMNQSQQIVVVVVALTHRVVKIIVIAVVVIAKAVVGVNQMKVVVMVLVVLMLPIRVVMVLVHYLVNRVHLPAIVLLAVRENTSHNTQEYLVRDTATWMAPILILGTTAQQPIRRVTLNVVKVLVVDW